MEQQIKSYHLFHRIVHWVMALLIILQIAMGIFSEWLPVGWKPLWMDIHTHLGIFLLLLFIGRLITLNRYSTPSLPTEIPKFEQMGIYWTHQLMYFLMALLPISGILRNQTKGKTIQFLGLQLPALVEKNRFLFDIFDKVHQFGAYLLAFLILLHVGGIFLQQWHKKLAIINRMTGSA